MRARLQVGSDERKGLSDISFGLRDFAAAPRRPFIRLTAESSLFSPLAPLYFESQRMKPSPARFACLSAWLVEGSSPADFALLSCEEGESREPVKCGAGESLSFFLFGLSVSPPVGNGCFPARLHTFRLGKALGQPVVFSPSTISVHLFIGQSRLLLSALCLFRFGIAGGNFSLARLRPQER